MKFILTQILLIFFTVIVSCAGELPSWINKIRPSNAPNLLIPGYSKLNASLQKNGVVKLIVRLAPPSNLTGGFVIEGHLKNHDEIVRQRSHIADIQNRLSKKLSKMRSDKVSKYEFIPYMAFEATQSEFESIVASADVEYIQEDVPVPPSLSQSVPLIGGGTGSFIGFSGNGQAVAILDTGVEKYHPLLAGKVVSEACFSSAYAPYSVTPLCISGSTAPGAAIPCSSSVSSSCKHGTHVAGIAAGKGGTLSGSPFNGVAKDASIIAIQVFSRVDDATTCGGAAPCILSYSSDQISAMNHIFSLKNTYNISSVNMSLGGDSYSTNCDADYGAVKAAIDLLRSVNIATIISSGNDGSTSSISAPACISSAISVGGTDKLDNLYSYSNISSILSLLAPGVNIYSSIPGAVPGANVYSTMTGTSMAAPHVAGAWAVLKSIKPTATIDELLAALSTTGKLITDTRSGAPGTISKPRIQLASAVLALYPPITPSIISTSAISITSINATLNSTVNDNRADTTVSFEYGITNSYGTTVAATTGGNITAGTGPTDSSVTLASLACNMTYHYRVKAVNIVGTGYGSDVVFTTTACPPGAPTITSTNAGNKQANLYFIPPDNGGSVITSYTVTSYTGQSVLVAETTIDLPINIPITVPNLINSDSYFFTLKATNSVGVGPTSELSDNLIPGIAIIDDANATGYQLLQDAYVADYSRKKIMLMADTPVGGFTVNSSNDRGLITIKGGYDTAFSDDGGLPSILGKVTLSAGTTKFQNVVIRP